MRGLYRLWGRGESTSLGTVKKVLLSLLVVGLLGTVTGRGVQAALNSESANTGSTASAGTLTLSATITGQSACVSYLAGSNDNHNVACAGTTGMLFSGATLRWPGEADVQAVTVQNSGSVNAQALEVAATCTDDKSAGSVTRLVGTEGTGSPCGATGLEFYIQETKSDGSVDTTTNGCLYPDTNSPHVVGKGSGVDCTTAWTIGSLRSFKAKTCWDLGPLNAQASRYFKIGLRFAPDAANTLQGTQADITFKWVVVSNDPWLRPSCSNDS